LSSPSGGLFSLDQHVFTHRFWRRAIFFDEEEILVEMRSREQTAGVDQPR
jgi:hypothetical protein